MLRRDEPTDNDRLGFAPYVEGIANLVREARQESLPFVVGVYGSWGSGKTSFMKQVEQKLKEVSNTPPPIVWFEAWKYDRLDDVRSAFVYRILCELEEKAVSNEGGQKTAIRAAMKKTAQVARFAMTNAQLNVGVNHFNVALPSINEMLKEMKKYQTAVDELGDAFKKAVENFVSPEPPSTRKLVVFVDDLDRCLPENMVVCLEAMKLFLCSAPCVFVIGVDRLVVEKAVEQHYGTESAVSGRSYLDKVIQYHFTVPQPNNEQLWNVFGAELASRLDNIERKIIDVCCAQNPRTFCRIAANLELALRLANSLSSQEQGNLLRNLIVLVVCLSVRFPRLYETIIRDPAHFKTFAYVCSLKKQTTAGDETLERDACGKYIESWQDVEIKSLFQTLSADLQESVPWQHCSYNQDVLRNALGLAARVSGR